MLFRSDYTYSGTYIDAKVSGFDVKTLIPKNKKFNLSIQLYIADEFNLDNDITISIDNVSLIIWYTYSFSDTSTKLDLFLDNENKTKR